MCSRILIAILLISGRATYAQQVVQQPVVGTTSVSTTVSVPDRGRVFVGGVSSAQSGRSQYGPFRSGTSSGFTRQSSSISTSVYIHDFEAMDEELLNSAPSVPETRLPALRTSSAKTEREPVAQPLVSTAEKAAKFEQLARKADDAGKTTLARLHWQMAAKFGSKVAEQHLSDTTPTPSQSTRRTASR